MPPNEENTPTKPDLGATEGNPSLDKSWSEVNLRRTDAGKNIHCFSHQAAGHEMGRIETRQRKIPPCERDFLILRVDDGVRTHDPWYHKPML
jgi:hypothetical protein